MPAMPPFMSQLPRPYSRPSRISGWCGWLVHCPTGSAETASMWPLRSSERPPPAPRRRAASCGRPTKSSPSGTTRLPEPVGSGSQTSVSAPSAARRRRRNSWSSASCRGGSPTLRAVVSNRTRSPASATSSSRPSRTAATTRSSNAERRVWLMVSPPPVPGGEARTPRARPPPSHGRAGPEARPAVASHRTLGIRPASLRRQLAEGEIDVDALTLAAGLPDEVPELCRRPTTPRTGTCSCPWSRAWWARRTSSTASRG